MLSSGRNRELSNERLIEKISEYPMNLYQEFQDGRRMTADPGARKKDNLPSITKNESIDSKKNRRRFLNTQQNFHSSKTGLSESERNIHTSSQKQIDPITQDIGAMLNLNSDRRIFFKERKNAIGWIFLNRNIKNGHKFLYSCN